MQPYHCAYREVQLSVTQVKHDESRAAEDKLSKCFAIHLEFRIKIEEL